MKHLPILVAVSLLSSSPVQAQSLDDLNEYDLIQLKIETCLLLLADQPPEVVSAHLKPRLLGLTAETSSVWDGTTKETLRSFPVLQKTLEQMRVSTAESTAEILIDSAVSNQCNDEWLVDTW